MVKAGDLAGAAALYAPTHADYERIKPVAQMFADLDAAIDARPDYYAAREKDPSFTGFRRIGYGLFTARSTDGLGSIADKLLADVTDMQGRAKAASIRPDKMTSGAAGLIRSVAASTGALDAVVLSDTAASVDGAGKIVALLQPLSRKADKALSDKIDAGFAAFNQDLAKYRQADGGFAADAALSKEDADALRTQATALADDLDKLGAALGLN